MRWALLDLDGNVWPCGGCQCPGGSPRPPTMAATVQVWEERKIAGALFMDVKSAFNNANKALLGKRMEALELEPDFI